MSDKCPFDAPYTSPFRTCGDFQFTEVLADGTTRPASPENSRRLQDLYSPSGDSVLANPSAKPEKCATAVSRPLPTVSGQSGAVTFLNVPFAQKDKAKVAGSKWDSGKKKWYVSGGADVELFRRRWG